MSASRRRVRPAAQLVLADGTTFEGEAIGALAEGTMQAGSGELVFNTAMSGYQEITTDPSYAGQVIAFTYPHIGNYGVAAADEQSARPFCRGIVVREIASRASSWRAEGDFEEFLTRAGIGGLTGVDTRRLTRHVRASGAMPCAFGTLERAELAARAAAEPGTAGVDLVSEVTTAQPYTLPGPGAAAGGLERYVVAYDFGIKRSILEALSATCRVDVVPAGTPAADVLARRPDGVFLSNGPGDPAALGALCDEIGVLLGEVPVFGICLGHQLLARTLGGTTYKLRFGHHGANQPIRHLGSGSVEVTSENHGYAVAAGSVTPAAVTHVNLNDGVIEGLACRDIPAFSVQYHPEASPGPHDARYLFRSFVELMDGAR